MKNLSLIAVLMVVLSVACNQSQEKQAKHNHSDMAAIQSAKVNVMMSAMDESMKMMHQVELTGNADYDFAALMVPHHKGAVQMAEQLLLAHGKSASLIDFARRVVETQKLEIKAFDAFLANAYPNPKANATNLQEKFNLTMQPMMKAMNRANLTNDVDRDFITLMIPHHESAVAMAKTYLPYAKNPKIKKMALAILQTQQEEIDWLINQK